MENIKKSKSDYKIKLIFKFLIGFVFILNLFLLVEVQDYISVYNTIHLIIIIPLVLLFSLKLPKDYGKGKNNKNSDNERKYKAGRKLLEMTHKLTESKYIDDYGVGDYINISKLKSYYFSKYKINGLTIDEFYELVQLLKDLKIISDDIEYSNLILNKITYSRVDSSLQKYDDFYKIILT